MDNSIKILPVHYNKSRLNSFRKFDFSLNHSSVFLNNAKEAIHIIMKNEGLKRTDEVMISTTSDSNFVSSCVTSTIFNYAKISRVLTDKTRLIFVIHEFGFPNKKIKNLYQIAKQRNIVLVEDSAHSFHSILNDETNSFFGKYLIHSLPKSIPISNGGILRLKKDKLKIRENKEVKDAFKLFSPYLEEIRIKKRQHFLFFAEQFKEFEHIYKLNKETSPFAFGFFTKKYLEIYQYLENEKYIELLRTYNKEWVVIPINAMHSDYEINLIAKSIKSVLK